MVKGFARLPGLLAVLLCLVACSDDEDGDAVYDSGVDADTVQDVPLDPPADPGTGDADAQDGIADGESGDGGESGDLDGAGDLGEERELPPGDASLDLDLQGPEQPGAYTVQIPSTVGDEVGIAVRVFYPGLDAVRYPEGAPIAVFVAGGTGTAGVDPERVDLAVAEHGYILVEYVFPGTSSEGATSGGFFDYRGPNCIQATTDVLRYALGDLADTDGDLLTDRLPYALVEVTGLLGSSNGGNLATIALARHANPDLAGVDWLTTWESPIGDQYALAELGRVGDTLNPTYVAGTGGIDGEIGYACPWPTLDGLIAFDPTSPYTTQDVAYHRQVTFLGQFFVDSNDNGSIDTGEFTFAPLAGPGTFVQGQHRAKAYHSVDLAEVLQLVGTGLFPDRPPVWLASLEETRSYWSDRDASGSIDVLHAEMPDLLVMPLATQSDHVQGQPDHPHIRGTVQAWLDAGHSFVRLNPDAAYLAMVTGVEESALVDNQANQPVPFPGINAVLFPEIIEDQHPSAITTAAILELSDRTYLDNRSSDLSEVLWPPN
ncbi:MAG: hypothetical protein JW797_03455 [Bradymonadales bacterium]|nr:hypothetical protein [Bradymonadales bacterium]